MNNHSHLLSSTVCEAINGWLKKFTPEQKQSALLPALTIVQEAHGGWLTDELIEAVADYLQIPRIVAFEAATFYSMYELKPVGKYRLYVCGSISCMLRGSDDLIHYLEQKLGIKTGETTADGLFTLKRVECLAACANAPAMRIGKDYYEDLTPEKIDAILQKLKDEQLAPTN